MESFVVRDTLRSEPVTVIRQLPLNNDNSASLNASETAVLLTYY